MDQIKNYFSEDIRAKIRDLSNADMKSRLMALEGTPTWFAILKYTQDRISVLQDSFLVLDPLAEGVKIARYQGAITGMIDLQDAVLSLKYDSKKKEDPKYKEEKKKEEAGGSYGVI